jgi:PPOX class probable F420-dependent enzyme, Rv2061 family
VSPELSAVAESEYVLLTTFRRSGEPVGTPVWVARDGDALLVTTGAASGKVKRLAHTADVTLTPCDVRGVVAPGAVPVAARAVVDDSPETRERVATALRGKYRAKYRMLELGGKLRRRPESVALVLSA